METRNYQSGAAASPPSAPASPSTGYPTNGDPSGPTPATLPGDYWFYKVGEELRAVISGAGLTPSDSDLTQLFEAIVGVSSSAYASRGLVAQNNVATPNTKFDAAADMVVLRNPTSGAVAVRSSVAAITCDVGVAGPAINGRDQAGAFTASSWIHFYFIWDGTTLATIASASAPPTGPTLPVGYTSWAYIAPVYFSAGSALAAVHVRGNQVSYDASQLPVNGGGAVTRTAVSLAAMIPPNAETFGLSVVGIAVSANGIGQAIAMLTLEVVSGVTAHTESIQVTTGASVAVSFPGSFIELPNISQNYYYFLTVTQGSGPATYNAVTGYKIPNGG
jgi:hypothetical protein